MTARTGPGATMSIDAPVPPEDEPIPDPPPPLWGADLNFDPVVAAINRWDTTAQLALAVRCAHRVIPLCRPATAYHYPGHLREAGDRCAVPGELQLAHLAGLWAVVRLV